MAKQVWYPEEGDEVRMADGRVGKVTYADQEPISTGEGGWQLDADFEEGDEERSSDIEVNFNEVDKVWEEVEG